MITVVTVVYNGIREIEKTVRSVLEQSGAKEYIIVDGGSTDGTAEVIKNFEGNINHWISEKDGGIYDAMNKGVSLASGEYVVFMNSGDTFHDCNVLEDVTRFIRSKPGHTIVYGDAEIVDSNGRHIQVQKDRHLDLTKSIIHQSMFIKRSYLQENPYDLRYSVMADYDNLLALTVIEPNKLAYVPRAICVYNKFGVSSRPLYTYFKEYYRIAFNRMPFWKWLRFNAYIIPRLVYSFKSVLASE